MPSRTVTIEKLVSGGAGLARTAGGVVLVNGAAPGETVTVEIAGKKGGVPHARAVRIIKASPARREPPCPLYGRCGGCDWLHMDYSAQVECKKAIFIDCMRRIGRIEKLPEIETVASKEFGYRQRAQFKCDGNGNAGFFARQTNDIVQLPCCPLLVDSLNRLLGEITEGKILLPRLTRNLKAVAGDSGKIASSPVITGRTGEKVLITAANKTFEVSGNGFFQSNRPLLERLGLWARDKVGGGRCVDLYGGSGFFSVMLADRFEQGLLIERAETEIIAARENFTRNSLSHFTAAGGTAERLASIAGHEPVDCLIVDPPRPGLTNGAREAAAALRPETILYVSCNPSTQARDSSFFVNQKGYSLSAAALFDLYPNTHHLESLLILKKGT